MWPPSLTPALTVVALPGAPPPPPPRSHLIRVNEELAMQVESQHEALKRASGVA